MPYSSPQNVSENLSTSSSLPSQTPTSSPNPVFIPMQSTPLPSLPLPFLSPSSFLSSLIPTTHTQVHRLLRRMSRSPLRPHPRSRPRRRSRPQRRALPRSSTLLWSHRRYLLGKRQRRSSFPRLETKRHPRQQWCLVHRVCPTINNSLLSRQPSFAFLDFLTYVIMLLFRIL